MYSSQVPTGLRDQRLPPFKSRTPEFNTNPYFSAVDWRDSNSSPTSRQHSRKNNINTNRNCIVPLPRLGQPVLVFTTVRIISKYVFQVDNNYKVPQSRLDCLIVVSNLAKMQSSYVFPKNIQKNKEKRKNTKRKNKNKKETTYPS